MRQWNVARNVVEQIREMPSATQFNSFRPLILFMCVYVTLFEFAIFTLFLSPFISLSHLIISPSRTQKCRQKVYCMSLSANGSGMRFPTVYTKNILIFYYDAKTYKIIFSTLFFVSLCLSISSAHRKLYVHTVHFAMLCCTFGKCMMKMLGPNLLSLYREIIWFFFSKLHPNDFCNDIKVLSVHWVLCDDLQRPSGGKKEEEENGMVTSTLD